jgi:hypothetical protein
MSKPRKQEPLDLLGWPHLSSNPEAFREMVQGEGWKLLSLDLKANLEEAHRRLYLSDEGRKADMRRGSMAALMQFIGLHEAAAEKKKE